MSLNISNNLKHNNQKRRFINKGFDDFKNTLFNYASQNFPNQIKDFSEASLGGMLLDFASIVGESISFYAEQQFDELDYETASNPDNIIKHLRRAGITSNYSSPSIVNVTFYIEIDSSDADNLIPKAECLPIIRKGTTMSSTSGIDFILEEDIDFSKDYIVSVGDIDDDNKPTSLILEKSGLCVSGNVEEEVVNFPSNNDNLFLTFTLERDDVASIERVIDNNLNEYYEVEYLSQDCVYTSIEDAKESFFQVKLAPYRFAIEHDFNNNKTLIRFGNGEESSLKDNILTNPEDISLPLKGRGYTSKYSIDPMSLLKSKSLGISPQGKKLSIKYRYGGGESHNVKAESISILNSINIDFPNLDLTDNDNVAKKELILESVSVLNDDDAIGGTNKMSLQELQNLIPTMKKMQNRIINHKDLLSKIYTMPSNFGRVHKAAVLTNPYSNLSKDLYVICKDTEDFYVYAPDTLKINLKNYINEFRLIGDSFNILDAPIFNFVIDLTVKVRAGFDAKIVMTAVKINISRFMRFDAFQIGQAINVNDIINIVLNTDGILSIITLPKNIIKARNTNDNFSNEDTGQLFAYSNNNISLHENYENGLVYPNLGGIFELKYTSRDIIVRNG